VACIHRETGMPFLMIIFATPVKPGPMPLEIIGA
jgi:hypothetical protein